MFKFIIGLLIGILVTSMMFSVFYDKKKIEHQIERYEIATEQFRKGLEIGTQWGITLQKHEELMEREVTE